MPAITLSIQELPSSTSVPLPQTDTATAAHHAPTTSHKLRCTAIDWFQTFPFQQFHVLFDSLFKVLFIFPSQYLFAIGLPPLFSLRWNIPPTLGCSPKQPDSVSWPILSTAQLPYTGLSPFTVSCSKELWQPAAPRAHSLNYNSSRGFQI